MSDPEVLDCELTLADWDKASLRFAGREFSGRPAFDEACLQRLRAALDPLEYGRTLFEALLPAGSGLLTAYRNALLGNPPRLRLRLHLWETVPSALHGLRWELLYDPEREIPLGCSRDIAFSRSCAVPELMVGPVDGTLRLLVALANPSDLAEFGLPAMDPAAARDALEEALTPLADRLRWDVLDGPVTAARLRDRLVGGRYHVLHLQAHGALFPGRGSACVALEGQDGRTELVDRAAFSQIFEGVHDLRLATLVSCHSGLQSNDAPLSGLGPGLVRRSVPAVLAMRQAIGFDAARLFCTHFYRNLARSGLVDQAANEARNHLRLAQRDSDEWGVPVLFLRLRDGRLWARDGGRTVSEQSPWPWPALVENVRHDDLVPFLGPELGSGLLPSPKEIARRLAAGHDRLALDGRSDLPAVAQYVEIKDGYLIPHSRLSALLVEALLARKEVADRTPYRGLGLAQVVEKLAGNYFVGDPDEPHRLLAEMPLSTYVTTNYDPVLAAALCWNLKPPQVAHYPLRPELLKIPESYQDIQGSKEKPLVFHLYGVADQRDSLVLTEDDYLDFVRATAQASPTGISMGLPHGLKAKLSKAMLLFLGYDVRRLECRALLRGVVTQLLDRRERIAVFQIDPADAGAPDERELREYIKGCCEKVNIKVFYGSVGDFLKELRKRLGGDRVPA